MSFAWLSILSSNSCLGNFCVRTAGSVFTPFGAVEHAMPITIQLANNATTAIALRCVLFRITDLASPPPSHVCFRLGVTLSLCMKICQCRPVDHLPQRVETAPVARAVPTVLQLVPRDDATQVRAVGRPLVQLTLRIAEHGYLVQPA